MCVSPKRPRKSVTLNSHHQTLLPGGVYEKRPIAIFMRRDSLDSCIIHVPTVLIVYVKISRKVVGMIRERFDKQEVADREDDERRARTLRRE